nr:hypothetical protein [Microctonus hyperodae filamentous virus]
MKNCIVYKFDQDIGGTQSSYFVEENEENDATTETIMVQSTTQQQQQQQQTAHFAAIQHFYETLNLITLDESTHTYSIRDKLYWPDQQRLYSSTQICQRLFQPFMANVIAHNICRSKNAATREKYADILAREDPETELKKKWQLEGQQAAKFGTALHKYIENFYKSSTTTDDNIVLDSNLQKQIDTFQQFHEAHVATQWQPFIMEMAIFDRDYPICGTIDSLFITKTQTYNENLMKNGGKKISVIMCDWKTCKQDLFLPCKYRVTYGRGPLADLPDTKINRYALQQNIYRYILEKDINNYNVIVEEMYLVCFIKDGEGGYRKVPVERFDNRLVEKCILYFFDNK